MDTVQYRPLLRKSEAVRETMAAKLRCRLQVLEELFCAMPSSVFRPIDLILKALFVTARNSDGNRTRYAWLRALDWDPRDATFEYSFLLFRIFSYLSLLILVLRIVLTHSEEDIVLDRLQDFREDLGE